MVHLPCWEHMTRSKQFRVIFEEFFEHRLCYDEPRCDLSGWRGRAEGSNCPQDVGVYAGSRGGKGWGDALQLDYMLDTQRRELHHAGAPIKLRRKCFRCWSTSWRIAIGSFPSKNSRAPVARPVVGEAALTSCIQALRQALGERGRTPRFLRTLHGQGYRFVGAVGGEYTPADDRTDPAPARPTRVGMLPAQTHSTSSP